MPYWLVALIEGGREGLTYHYSFPTAPAALRGKLRQVVRAILLN
ncbi:MAG: hypothetical protein P4L38_06715 [Syntrophaceae bacterium]|nr:hypothetical protein [Syntrophaceae bacterium]